MIELKPATPAVLADIVAMERAADTADFIIPCSVDEHRRRMADDHVVYLTVLEADTLVGFIVLVLDDDGRSVEFRRIVIGKKGLGLGQQAIGNMEAYCRDVLARSRIWLDVFEHNSRGRYLYEKLGYVLFAEAVHDGRALLLYEKTLVPAFAA